MPGKKKSKPKPIKMSVVRKAEKRKAAPVPAEAPQAFNEVSPITQAQINRAERAIDNLREEVRDIRKTPPKVKVEAPNPKVVVELPPRARIARVTVKYDEFGIPKEFIPQYAEPAV